jgi:hypothetical protein
MCALYESYSIQLTWPHVFVFSLLVLQTKAEEEISKARKLISYKDAELLNVAEESLS